MVESSTEESAGSLSLGPRESGMVSTGRPAVSPELLEVELCTVFPQGRRTQVDVRQGDQWVEYRNGVGVDGREVVAVGRWSRGGNGFCC